jgi:hypothetical protein
MIVALLYAVSPSASAASFSSRKAFVQTAGVSCLKKGMVEITDTMIQVECKKAGYAPNIADLHDMSWSVAKGKGTMTARETSGDQFVVTVKKKEFADLKAALLANLGASPVPAPKQKQVTP